MVPGEELGGDMLAILFRAMHVSASIRLPIISHSLANEGGGVGRICERRGMNSQHAEHTAQESRAQ